jgi:hypothetical protein
MLSAGFFDRHSTNRPILCTVRFEVLEAALMTTAVFWDVTPCRMVTLLTFRRDAAHGQAVFGLFDPQDKVTTPHFFPSSLENAHVIQQKGLRTFPKSRLLKSQK